MVTRRRFLHGGTAAVMGAALVSRAGAATLPEAPQTSTAETQPPPAPPDGRGYRPVVTLNGGSLPWWASGKWKEFVQSAKAY